MYVEYPRDGGSDCGILPPVSIVYACITTAKSSTFWNSCDWSNIWKQNIFYWSQFSKYSVLPVLFFHYSLILFCSMRKDLLE